jgi:3-deoxy-D-manno-octulosonic-acid transferase
VLQYNNASRASFVWAGLYQIALAIALPFVALRLWWRGVADPRYREGRSERWGHIRLGLPTGALWFHTVSAGEASAAAPLIRLAAEHAGPVLVTTMTPTGADAVQRLLGNRVVCCYAPYDFGWVVRRFLERVQPRALVLIETELWPNLIALSRRREIPIALVNARLSERSASGYRLIGPLTRRMLGSLEMIACQYPDHAERFIRLGAPEDRVAVLGSVKFDVVLPPDLPQSVERLRARLGLTGRPVWIAASTHGSEESIVLDAHRSLTARFPTLALVLVPRHPERFDEVARLASVSGFRTRRMTNEVASGEVDVVIGDTMGRLLELYGLASVAFVGGSLVERGGHNPIEPAALGVPVLMGPHDFNFADVSALFEHAGCLHRVTDTDSLVHAVARLLSDVPARTAESTNARRVVEQNRGATDRQWRMISSMTGVLRRG